MPSVYGTNSQLANYLISNPNITPFNVSSSGPDANFGTLYYCTSANSTDANGLETPFSTIVDEIFAYLESLLGINFEKTTNESLADILFANDGAGASTWIYDTDGNGYTDYSTINVSSSWNNGSAEDIWSGYVYKTYMHEILHAIGLGHQGPYNGSGTTFDDAYFYNDSWLSSIMSYFDQLDNPNIPDVSYAIPQTLMVADILALDYLYGTQGAFGSKYFLTTDTVFGFNTNITYAVSPTLSFLSTYGDTNTYCIVDGGGKDTFDFSGWSANQTINLTVTLASSIYPTLSSIGGLVGNLTLAVGTVIENAISGGGNDKLFGNYVNNRLEGGAGNDYLDGTGGNDTLIGGSGNDTYVTNGGETIIEDAAGGIDLVRSSVSITLSSNVESLVLTGTAINGTGNASGNTIIGNSGANWITGLGGRDVMTGAAGADTFVFRNFSDSSASLASSDVITDFVVGLDRIGLGSLDASIATPGTNDAFLWAGTGAFNTSAAGQVRYSQDVANNRTIVYLDNDSDTDAEMIIILNGLLTLTQNDFSL
jgi:serralysin